MCPDLAPSGDRQFQFPAQLLILKELVFGQLLHPRPDLGYVIELFEQLRDGLAAAVRSHESTGRPLLDHFGPETGDGVVRQFLPLEVMLDRSVRHVEVGGHVV